MTTHAATLASLWSIVACSSFLTKLVKPGVISRAKTAATGTSPSRQTGQALVPAYGPATLTGLKGATPSPTAWAGLECRRRSWCRRTTPAATAATRNLLMESGPFVGLDRKTAPNGDTASEVEGTRDRE